MSTQLSPQQEAAVEQVFEDNTWVQWISTLSSLAIIVLLVMYYAGSVTCSRVINVSVALCCITCIAFILFVMQVKKAVENAA